jgi:hypothetical protein
MVGNYNEQKGAWEIICDDLGIVIGYVNQENKPDEDHYFGLLCQTPTQETYNLYKTGNILMLNTFEKTPTNSIINFAVQDLDKVRIELNNEIYECYLNNTTINSQTPNSITDLYNQYMILIS